VIFRAVGEGVQHDIRASAGQFTGDAKADPRI